MFLCYFLYFASFVFIYSVITNCHCSVNVCLKKPTLMFKPTFHVTCLWGCDEVNGPFVPDFLNNFLLIESWSGGRIRHPFQGMGKCDHSLRSQSCSGRQTRQQGKFAQRKMYCDNRFMAIFLSQFILSFHSIHLINITESILNFKGTGTITVAEMTKVVYLLESSFPDRRNLRLRNATLSSKSHLAKMKVILNLYILASSVLFPWEYLC